MKVNYKILVSVLLFGLMLSIVGCASGTADEATSESSTTDETTAGETATSSDAYALDYEGALARTSGKKFEGETVVLLGASGQVEFVAEAAKPWEEATGATVEVVKFPMSELQDKVIVGLAAGTFVGDVINIAPYLAGDLMGGGYIEPVPDDVKERLDWEDILPVFRNNQTDWGGVTYGYPWDGDVHSLYYRKDILEDPDIQQKFEERFGYALDVPKTWDEFRDQSVFFTETDLGDGKQHYGAVMLLMRKNHGIHGFTSVAASFAKMPDDPAFYFDPETMKPRINNEGFVTALQYIVDLAPYMPPDNSNLDWFANLQAFTSGLAFMDIQWADVGIMAYDPEISVVGGKVGYAMTPGSTKTFDARTNEWVDFPDVNYVPYAAYGGWQNIVPVNAEAKEAAIDLATYLATPEMLLYASVTPGSGVNPARESTLEDTAAWLGIFPDEEDVAAYLDVQKTVMEHPNTIFQLRIPGYIQYQDALELAVSKALAGQATPQEALDEAAQSWEDITERLGREDQAKLYRQSIGIE